MQAGFVFSVSFFPCVFQAQETRAQHTHLAVFVGKLVCLVTLCQRRELVSEMDLVVTTTIYNGACEHAQLRRCLDKTAFLPYVSDGRT